MTDPTHLLTEAAECCGGNCGCHAPLLDMSDVQLRAALADSSPAYARAIDRLVKSLDDPNGVISAFSSFAE
jgi:hypothetical protein